MKFTKKTAMVTSFVAGALIFTSTAFADIVSLSGYEQLKSAAKFTEASCTDTLKNYTTDYTGDIKVDGKIIGSGTETSKIDNIKKALEHTNQNQELDGTIGKGFSYEDKQCTIYLDSEDNTYRVDEYKDNSNRTYMPQNTFKESRTKDAEKILDALVGNLKDLVVVSEKTDGTKEFSGSIQESQVPAIGNALLSFLIKDRYGRYESDSSDNKNPFNLSDDIYLKEGNLKVTANKDGLITDAFMTASVSGKDEKQQSHDVILKFSFKMHDINSTVVTMPDLNGKKVNKHVVDDDNNQRLTKIAIGKYSSDIILNKDDKLIKIGEKILEITSVDGNKATCKYHEEYNKGYESYSNNKYATPINFEVSFDKNLNASFVCTDNNGNKVNGNLSFEVQGVRTYFNLGRSDDNMFTSNVYSRVFDN